MKLSDKDLLLLVMAVDDLKQNRPTRQLDAIDMKRRLRAEIARRQQK